MLGIIGTIPDPHLHIITGQASLIQDKLSINGHLLDIDRGTPALLGAACKVCTFLGKKKPIALLVGDIGLGKGSRNLYAYLEKNLNLFGFQTLTFHYLQPNVDWHNRVLFAVQDLSSKPVLIADAGFMYAAKMSGQAQEYHLFTPDLGELAFLADEKAPHPFYTRGFIIHQENNYLELIKRSYQHQNAAKYMLVKGKKDIIVHKGKIISEINDLAPESMEAIGGTGDTLTGIVSVLVYSGFPIDKACILASKINRLAGKLTQPTPATPIKTIIQNIPYALEKIEIK